MNLCYSELKKDAIMASTVEDINVLLPQLSQSIQLRTREWLEYVLDSGTRIFVAKDGDRIVGVVLLCQMVILAGLKHWIEDVVVDLQYRGLGIASRLMDLAEVASRESGATCINLTSNPNREVARRMYENRGYNLCQTGVFRLTY